MPYKFLIIIPVYNTDPKFLSQCFETLLKQTYKEWRCIIVDDKSTSDLTLSFLKAFLPQRPQFSYVRNKDNVGCGESRNIGLAHATEKDDLIWFVDSDDYLTTSALEVMNNYFNEFPQLEILAFTCINLLANANYGFQVSYDSKVPHSIDEDHTLLGCSAGAWSRVFKQSFIKDHKLLFPHRNIFHEDLYFWIVSFSRAKYILSITDYIYVYRIYVPNSMCDTWAELKKVTENLEVIKLAYDEIKNDHSYISQHYGELFSFLFYERLRKFHKIDQKTIDSAEYKSIMKVAADFQNSLKKPSK